MRPQSAKVFPQAPASIKRAKLLFAFHMNSNRKMEALAVSALKVCALSVRVCVFKVFECVVSWMCVCVCVWDNEIGSCELFNYASLTLQSSICCAVRAKTFAHMWKGWFLDKIFGGWQCGRVCGCVYMLVGVCVWKWALIGLRADTLKCHYFIWSSNANDVSHINIAGVVIDASFIAIINPINL